MHLIKVGKGDEVLATLWTAVAELGITAGSITLIGAVQTATVSVMKKDDALTDYLRTYDQPLELSGTGEIADGKVHLHVTLYGEDFVTGGHLHNATVQDFFVHAYVTPL
ncbi:DNA-binding protein [Actinoplanes sp. NEAU-A12]|uniref:DNA-binding protein n=1 Tax=Actinoplanes sandaracinus TaxID=3045177 RepID=A0ABT6WR80_9ACTN|nr:PPC domain-containing DNA-binding protein [Actinoplanes sandaracinus]MDI6102243.1 DNA-binding protein [Actinoplanes sandaracinus]